MKHFYFVEENSGEEFIVGASSLGEAWDTALEIGDRCAEDCGMCADVSYEYEMTDQEAEDSGLDEY